jgi:hypothetical protein
MTEKGKPIKSLKLTAAVYATRSELVEYVREHGRLPDEINPGGFPVAFHKIIEWRGTDIELTEKEKLIYDAIIGEERTPGGMVKLIEEV